MIYTKLTRQAMNIANAAHLGQIDRGRFPYIFHPIHVAEQMDDEYSCAAALLHDVMEDSYYTIEKLENNLFPEPVLLAVDILTHRKQDSYEQYIKKIATNPIARKVKIADLKHNMGLDRLLKKPTEKDLKRIEKYTEALHFLENQEKTNAVQV